MIETLLLAANLTETTWIDRIFTNTSLGHRLLDRLTLVNLRHAFYLISPYETAVPTIEQVPNYNIEVRWPSYSNLPYVLVWNNCRLLELPWDSPWTWILCLFFQDFMYYIGHRAVHEAGVFWGLHTIHHSSEYYNYSTALRQAAIQDAGLALYDVLQAFFIPPPIFLVHRYFSEISQFIMHTSKVRDGCTYWALKCDKRVARAAKTKCPSVGKPKVPAGCKMTTGKDSDGCPSWTIECVSANPPSIGGRVARAAKAKCPAVSRPKAPAGCKMTTGKDSNGCLSWTIECVSANPPSIGGRVARAAKAKCPVQIGTPTAPEGCKLSSYKDSNGCPVWNVECGSGGRVARAAKAKCPVQIGKLKI